ncbi:MAG: glycosyltransferase family 4 protein [Nitrospirae bacterium]|nr:glycosyltransferase family 4 protein [Nitrospirota bacterium]
MRILHVCPLYYPVVGGVENVFRAVSEGMAERGDDVTVFTTTGRSLGAFMNPMTEPLPSGEEMIHGVRVRRFPYRRVSRLAARGLAEGWSALRLPKGDLLKRWSSLPWVPNLSGEIVSYKPDIVLAGHFPAQIVFDAMKAKDAAGFPLIFHTALHLDMRDLSHDAVEFLDRADALWVNTVHERDTLVKRGIAGDKLHEFGVGVDPVQFQGACGKRVRERYAIGDRPVVLFAGRRERDKGVFTLLEAMERVWQHIPEAVLILAGPVVRYTDKRSLDPWLKKYQGAIIPIEGFNDDEKKDLFDACDLFVLPSRVESFGIVYLEAWISGKPVIGADIGSTRSIIEDGRDGFLVGFGDSGSLASRITHLLEHPGVGREMGMSGREKVLSRYTWGSILDRLHWFYRHLSGK